MQKNTESFYGQPSTSFREKGEKSLFQSFALELVPGFRCQLRCAACYKEGAETRRGGALPTDKAMDYIDQAKAVGFKEVVLIGGEPLLHPQAFDIIAHVREQGMTPILATNGLQLADPELAGRLEGAGSTVVTHAYFPGGESVIDDYSGRQGYTEKLKQAIKNLQAIPDVTLVLEMPLDDNMFPHAFEFFEHCRQEGIIPFIELSRSRDNGEATSSVTPEQVGELFQRFKEYDEEHFPDLVDQRVTPPAYGNKCTMSITGLHVKNFGDGDYGGVYSCCSQNVRHGDLREQALTEILTSSSLAVFMDQDRYIVGPCKECPEYTLCRGGCRGEAFLRFGCPRASSPACHLIPQEVRNNPFLMAPNSCESCPAEASDGCSLPDLNSLTLTQNDPRFNLLSSRLDPIS